MRVEIQTWKGTIGEVTLVGGVALRDAKAAQVCDSAHIRDPATFAELTPLDGERYLRALPSSLSGTYLTAILVEEPA